jgi:hypothetical protein
MTVEQANRKLALARKQSKKIREEIKALINFIRRNKAETHLTIERRNKGIYKLFLKPMSFKVIALHHDLSTAQIRNICLRMDKKRKKEDKVQAWIERNSK